MPTPSPPANVKVFHGMLVSYRTKPIPDMSMISFQYNPTELSRTLTPWSQNQNPDYIDIPNHTFNFTIKVEAVEGNSFLGLLPQLAALEIMAYPTTVQLAAYGLELAFTSSATPPQAPKTILIYGQRIVPVVIKSITVKEVLFNTMLTPIMADITLSLELRKPRELDDYIFIGVHVGFLDAWRITYLAQQAAGAISGLF